MAVHDLGQLYVEISAPHNKCTAPTKQKYPIWNTGRASIKVWPWRKMYNKSTLKLMQRQVSKTPQKLGAFSSPAKVAETLFYLS